MFEKKNERKVPGKKKSKCFFWKLKVKIFVAVKVKVGRKGMFESLVTFSWALCCKTWRKFKGKFAITGKKKGIERKKCLGGWLPR